MNNAKVISNMTTLVKAGVLALKQAGWSEARIIPELPFLAAEAIKYLQQREA